MPKHVDNWATIDRGPICIRCNQPKLNHGYYGKAYRCMSLRSSVFTEKTNDTIRSPLTIKRRREKTAWRKQKS